MKDEQNCLVSERFLEVFKEELGTIKDLEAKIFLKNKVMSRFLKNMSTCLELVRQNKKGISQTAGTWDPRIGGVFKLNSPNSADCEDEWYNSNLRRFQVAQVLIATQ